MSSSPPDLILTEELQAELRPWTGRNPAIEPLPGGLTNRNFLVTSKAGGQLVLRQAGQDTEALGIRRADEAECLRHAFALGIGAELLFADTRRGLFLTRYVNAKPLELSGVQRRPAAMEHLARLLRTLHDGPAIPGRFEVGEVIRSYESEAAGRGRAFPSSFTKTGSLRRRLEALLKPGFRPVPCHNDLLAGNLLYDGERLWLLDWEYAGMGDARFDLANLISNLELDSGLRDFFLKCYFGSATEAAARLPEIEAMLILSDLREAAWGFLQAALRSAAGVSVKAQGPADPLISDQAGTAEGFDYQAYGHQFLARALARKLPPLT